MCVSLSFVVPSSYIPIHVKHRCLLLSSVVFHLLTSYTSITSVCYDRLLLPITRLSQVWHIIFCCTCSLTPLSQVCLIILCCTLSFTPPYHRRLFLFFLSCTCSFVPLAQMCLIIFCSTCLLVLPPVTGVSYYLLGYPLLTWLSQVSLNIFRCTCTFTPLPQV